MNKKQTQVLVEAFEAGTYPSSQWTHESHVVMGLWYLHHWPVQQASEKIKRGVRRYNVSQGGKNTDTEGYHESITEFYIRILVLFLQRFDLAADFNHIMSAAVNEPFMRSSFPFDYYSKQRLMSVEARRHWVPPDLRPIQAYESTRRVFV